MIHPSAFPSLVPLLERRLRPLTDLGFTIKIEVEIDRIKLELHRPKFPGVAYFKFYTVESVRDINLSSLLDDFIENVEEEVSNRYLST